MSGSRLFVLLLNDHHLYEIVEINMSLLSFHLASISVVGDSAESFLIKNFCRSYFTPIGLWSNIATHPIIISPP